MVVSFSGIDGSGKTTMTDLACNYLRAKGLKAKIFNIYAGSLFLNIGKLLGKISHNRKAELEIRLAQGRDKGRSGLCALRRICLSIDIIIFRLRIFIENIRGNNVVCDRHLYDTLIHLKYLNAVDANQCGGFIKKIPRPDLPLVLFLDAESAKAREGRHEDLKYYEEKGRLYRGLSDELELIGVSASYEREAVWNKIKDMIESKLERQ